MRRIFLALVSWLLVVTSCAQSQKLPRYSVKVEQEYPHDTLSYTQGLFFDEGRFFETAGQYGESNLREVTLENGVPIRMTAMEKEIFAEGSCAIGDNIYVLTWRERLCFVYDKNTFARTGQFTYNRQGWGLTTDGRLLIMSDGSAQLYFISPKTFTTVRSVTVRAMGKSVNYLNELEYINGKIWANIYLKDEIVIIEPSTGEVEGIIDCRGLLPKNRRTERTDVLNGIAYRPETEEIFITGKYWPSMYKISIEQK
jgi:glutamine cyclotransferase